MIALLCDEGKDLWIDLLSSWEQVRIFPDGVELAYYLRDNGECSLALVSVDGADGMNWAAYARHQRPGLPVVWVSEQAGFEPRSRRIPVDGFLTKPVDKKRLAEILTDLLGPPKTDISKPYEQRRTDKEEDDK